MEVVPRLQVLTAVSTLSLSINQYGSCPRFFFPCFQNILTDLSICGTFLASDYEVIEMICSFPLLEQLALDYTGGSPYDSTHNKKPLYISKHLWSLQLDMERQSHFLQWFSSLIPLPPLRMLHLTSVSVKQSSATGSLLRTLGASLQHLHLSFFYLYRFSQGH